MINPFYRAILIILVACAISQGVFMLLDGGVQKFNSFTNERLSEIFVKNTDYNLITLGSSRSLSHVNPAIIDSVLGGKSYNVGMAGANIFEIKTVFYAYLEAHKNAPRYAILNIDRRTLGDTKKYYNNNIYYPYLSNVVIDTMMRSSGIKTYFYRYLPFTQLFEYDDYMRNIGLQGYRNKTEINAENIYYHGFMSSPRTKIFKRKTGEKLQFEGLVTQMGIKHLEDILNTCKQKNIQLIFIFSPELHEKQGEYPTNAALKTVDSLANIHQLKILRYDNLDSIYTPNDFADKGHLNGNTANRFSLQLATDLKNLMK